MTIRMVYTDNCGNQRIKKHQAFRDLWEFLTEDRGYGVQALEPIAAGDVLSCLEARQTFDGTNSLVDSSGMNLLILNLILLL